MDHKSDVTLVNAHPESYRCNNYVDLISHPTLLYVSPRRIGHACVVKITFDLEFAQLRAELLTFITR